MADRSKIEWTDGTWPVVTGCTLVSEGCRHCYAARDAAGRLRHVPRYRGLTRMTPRGARWTGEVRCNTDVLEQPLRWQKARRVFVASTGDLFHPAVPDDFIDQVFAVMALCSRHTFQVLTKRPARMKDYLANEHLQDRVDDASCSFGACHANLDGRWPLPNVWTGTSVEDQEVARQRIPFLLQTLAAVRFVSCEPLFASINLRNVGDTTFALNAFSGQAHHVLGDSARTLGGLDWVIVGGESGPRARPCNVEWIRSIVAQCRAAGVACYVKQLGAFPVTKCSDPTHPYCVDELELRDPKGRNPDEWPADLRVKEWPQTKGEA